MHLLRDVLWKHRFIDKLEVSELWLIALKLNLFTRKSHETSTPSPLRLKWNTKTHKADIKDSLKIKGDPLKRFYNELKEMVISGLLCIDIAFKRCSPYSSVSVSFVFKCYHVYLKLPWINFLACSLMGPILYLSKQKILAHDALQLWLWVLHLFPGLDIMWKLLNFCYIICYRLP